VGGNVAGFVYLVPNPLDDQTYAAILPRVELLLPTATAVEVEFAAIAYPNAVVQLAGREYLEPNPLDDQG
jgi:hypothetical protein